MEAKVIKPKIFDLLGQEAFEELMDSAIDAAPEDWNDCNTSLCAVRLPESVKKTISALAQKLDIPVKSIKTEFVTVLILHGLQAMVNDEPRLIPIPKELGEALKPILSRLMSSEDGDCDCPKCRAKRAMENPFDSIGKVAGSA